MEDYVREVEKVIDDYHKQSPLFSLNRKTALFSALTVFEDCCRLSGTASIPFMNDSLEYSLRIREQLDAINVLIQWIYQDCSHKDDDIADMSIISERYLYTAGLLELQARPYSPICSAYISYSRGHHTVEVNEKQKRITFLDNPNKRSIVISDLMETILGDQTLGLQFAPAEELPVANSKLISSIQFQGGHISYSMEDEIWIPFQAMMERQWNSTSELPEEWEFDAFSIKDFKYFWIAISTLSFIHMIACLKSDVPGCAVEDAVLVKAPSEFLHVLAEKTEISTDSMSAILKFLTYNDKLKNNDVVYQPFVEIDNDKLALAPHLVLASRPERNLISLIHKLKDKSYFDLTNLREGIMQGELDAITDKLQDAIVVSNKSLPGTLPDIDYAIWDRASNAILLCELKWLIEADSTTEVYARIQDIEHGCSQISDIIAYAKSNSQEFCNKVFGMATIESTPEFIGCVISKKGIRVDNSNIPVISLQTILNLLTQDSLSRAFEAIKERTYLIPAPQNFEFGLQSVSYAGYTFEIPALIKDQPIINGTYKRIGKKVGANELCPCGSGKKYKKCCRK